MPGARVAWLRAPNRAGWRCAIEDTTDRDPLPSDGDGPREPPVDERGSGAPAQVDDRPVVSLYRHPLAAVGGALIVAGVLAFLFLAVQDLTAPTENPYRSLVAFVIMPVVIGLGVVLFLVAVRLQVVGARRRGESVRFSLRVEPTDPRYMRSLWLFLGLSVVGISVVGFTGFKAYEATDSNAFCGEMCHAAMEPEAVAHELTAHAEVTCVDCHIGPGTEAYVEAKINGIRQLWAVITDSFERPVETPIEMRSSAEVCEQCHWRDNPWGSAIKQASYFSRNDAVTPWSINLVFDLGVARSAAGVAGGVHWHASEANMVEYVAEDEKLQEIVWVRVTDEGGTQRVYSRPGDYIPELDDGATEIRRFDCLDCHNRPAHALQPASRSINEALADGRLSAALPDIKSVALDLLLTHYATRAQAHDVIPAALRSHYMANSDTPAVNDAQIDAAAGALLAIYDANFFPEMETDYRIRQYNIGHLAWDGCFRCHDGEKQDEAGRVISNDCGACHTIVSQGPYLEIELPELTVAGLAFEHPFGVTGWVDRRCSGCHARLEGLR